MRYDSPFFSASSPSLMRGTRAGEAPADRTPHPIRRVLAASMKVLVNGFAEAGECMYPSFFELGDYMYGHRDEMRTPYGCGISPEVEETRPAPPMKTAQPAALQDGRWTIWPLGRLWSGLRNAYRRRQTREALEALDDEALHDIGLARGEIDRVVTHENLFS